ncbi:hypothetical protein [Streptomyces chartreusis]
MIEPHAVDLESIGGVPHLAHRRAQSWEELVGLKCRAFRVLPSVVQEQ